MSGIPEGVMATVEIIQILMRCNLGSIGRPLDSSKLEFVYAVRGMERYLFLCLFRVPFPFFFFSASYSGVDFQYLHQFSSHSFLIEYEFNSILSSV